MYEIRRAEIWIANLKDKNGIIGIHPVIAISNSKCLENSNYIQVVPVSSQVDKGQCTHLRISNSNLQKDSVAVVESIQRISKKQLKYRVGQLSIEDNIKLDALIQFQLGMLSFDELEHYKEVSSIVSEINLLYSLYIRTSNSQALREYKMYYLKLKDYCNKNNIKIRNWWIKKRGVDFDGGFKAAN